MHAPKVSVVWKSRKARTSVERCIGRLEKLEGLSKRLALTQLRYDLGLMEPAEAARHAEFEKFAMRGHAYAARKRDRASARRILAATVPTLDSMRRFFEDAPQPVELETIDDLLGADQPEWVETAKKAKMLAAALSLSKPFEWTTASVAALRSAASGRTWLEGELATRVGMSPAKFHDIAYRKSARHRVAK